jgi:predicted ester cyclase
MPAEHNRKTLQACLDCFNDRTHREGYFELYDRTVRLHGYAPEPLGYGAMRQFYTGLWTAFPDATVYCDQFICEGENLALRFHMTGTHRGKFMGVRPTGKSIVLQGHTTMRFSGGRVVERWSTADFLGLLVQLGGVSLPEA